MGGPQGSKKNLHSKKKQAKKARGTKRRAKDIDQIQVRRGSLVKRGSRACCACHWQTPAERTLIASQHVVCNMC
jgi:hypothetical protein